MANDKGFTLIEMMIVLVIIGIIATTSYPSLSGAAQRSNENERAKHEDVVNKALKQHYALTGTYPNQGVHDSSTSTLTSAEMAALASDLAEQTGVRLNTREYIYTYPLNGSGHYDVTRLQVDFN